MSDKEAKAKGGEDLSKSDLPLTRNQALAVAWSGIEILVKRGEAKLFNDPENNRAVIIFANTEATPSGFKDAK